MPEKPVGKVEHYYPKVKAAAVKLTGNVKVGDTVHIVGHGDDVTEKLSSIQEDHVPIQEGKAGHSVGLYIPEKVHEGDDVLLVSKKQKPMAPSRRAPSPAARPKAKSSKPKARKAKARKAPARKAKPKGKSTGRKSAGHKSAGRKSGRKPAARSAKRRPAKKAKRAAGRKKR